MNTDIVVAGHICLDIIPTLSGGTAFEPGMLVETGPAVLSTGGTVSNTGLALNKLGADVGLLGKVGDDLFGQAIKELLEKQRPGLSQSMVTAEGEPTSYTVVVSPPGQDRMFLHCPGCNDTFGPEDLHDDTLESTRHLHFGYPSLMKRMYQNDGEELEELLKQAKAFGVTTSLDLSFPDPESEAGKADWRKILSRALPYTDLFLPSVEELLFMIRREDYDRLSAKGDVLRELRDDSIYGLANEALSMGASVVALKAGDRGVYLRTADKFGGEMGRSRPANPDIWQGLSLHEEVYDVEVEGTAGSGDTTIAGFLYGWINGYPPERALQIATAVGAFCCEAADAVSGVRTWEETQQRIESGWRKLQV